MKSGNKDKAEAQVDKAAGKTKEVAGRATGNRSMEREGQRDQAKGHAKAAAGELKKSVSR